MRGQVAVSMDVDETGKVASVRLLRSSAPNHWVDTMVLQAARDWLFTPATVHGHPVPASVEITFDLNRR
jgi:TonB family protein